MQLTFSPEDLNQIAELVAQKILDRLPANGSDDQLMTEAEAAQFCRVKEHSLRDARRRGVLKCGHAGRSPRYTLAQLNAWMAGQGGDS